MRMFLRFLFIFLALLLLPSLLSRRAQASSQQAYQDYLYQFDQYRQTYSAFTSAKNEYLKFKSLTSQTTALAATTTMLEKRDGLLRSYLLLLTEKLNEDRGITDAQKSSYRGRLEEEIAFLDRHKGTIASVGSLEEAIRNSADLESHNPKLQVAIRQTIIGVSGGQLAQIAAQLDAGLREANELATLSRSTFSPQKQATIDRWLLQIENVRSLYKQTMKEIEGRNDALIKRSADGLDDAFRELKADLGQAKQYLAQANGFMGELIVALQYQN